MSDLLEHQFLTLSLDGERYAIPVGHVREVLECSRVTRLPRAAPYLRGLIDLRGRGVPVLDLRLRFGMPEAAIGATSAVIVVEPPEGSGSAVFGLLADAVHEVVEIGAENTEMAPRFGTGSAGDFLTGVGRQDGNFVLLLDLGRILAPEELEVPEAVPEAVLESL